jgi:lycopene cyclase domain-containing protein
LTYFQFLVVFLIVPICVLGVVLRAQITRGFVLTVVVISVVAIVYTGPWDNAIIEHGVWSYGPKQVAGMLIGRVPLEEYGFYVLQVALTGLITIWALRRDGRS